MVSIAWSNKQYGETFWVQSLNCVFWPSSMHAIEQLHIFTYVCKNICRLINCANVYDACHLLFVIKKGKKKKIQIKKKWFIREIADELLKWKGGTVGAQLNFLTCCFPDTSICRLQDFSSNQGIFVTKFGGTCHPYSSFTSFGG